MADFLVVLMRWLHIGSAAALVGGLLYGGVVAPQADVSRFRAVVLTAIPASLISGIYNIMSFPGHSVRYHVLLGIKILLAAHIFTTALLVVTEKARRPGRAMTGAAISGFVVIAIAAYLHRIF